MSSSIAITALICILATTVTAQNSDTVSLCTTNDCGTCPNTLTTRGTGYPACVIYDRDRVLGGTGGDYETEGNSKVVYFDIVENPDSQCRTIIRTPANTDEQNCGYPVYGGRGGVCTKVETKSTFMVQFCCGTGDCTAAGAEKRDDNTYTMSSVILHDSEGNMLMPQSVGRDGKDMMELFLQDSGLNSSSAVAARSSSGALIFKIGYPNQAAENIQKRGCDHYDPDGAPYTKTGSISTVVSDYICDSTSQVTITNEHSVARTTTFGSSVSDPFGIVSASIMFSTEEEASNSHSYTFTPMDGDCGHVAFTPFYRCTGGTITGCDNGPQKGEVCTAKYVDNSSTDVDGIYHFVQTG